MKIELDQSIVPLEKNDLKKTLINEYLKCEVDSENRTDYLVNVYEAARFFALSGFFLMLLLAAANYLGNSPSDSAKHTIRELRRDPILIDLLRGPKGEKGDLGPRGPKGEKGDPALSKP